MGLTNFWRKVHQKARVWASPDAVHKMGWLLSGSKIFVTEIWKDEWFRFTSTTGATTLLPWGAGYKEWWVKISDLGVASPVDFEDPPAVPAEALSDAEIGRVVRYLLSNFK